jgi:hypothetical protein
MGNFTDAEVPQLRTKVHEDLNKNKHLANDDDVRQMRWRKKCSIAAQVTPFLEQT